MKTWNERRTGVENARCFGPPMRWSDAILDPNVDMRRVTAAMLGMDPDASDPEAYEPTEAEIDAWMISVMDDSAGAE